MKLDNQPLYRFVEGAAFACSNVHNVSAARGRAGAESHFPRVAPGESLTVAEFDGPAVITRFWITFDWTGKIAYPNSTLRNRLVSLEITWDDADTPAIHVPVGDFFCHPLCYDVPFENAFFASPVGRSLMCFIPMPFRKRARIRIVNDFDTSIVVFHDIRFVKGLEMDPNDGYLHACFNRTLPTEPGRNHDILPRVNGKGRYIGTHFGIMTDPFNSLHWHGINPKFFLDDDAEHPSMMGASIDDFGGASWHYDRPYMHQDSGMLLSRTFALGGGHYGAYFYHRRDRLFFSRSCAASLRPGITLSGERLLGLLSDHPGLADRLAIPFSIDEIKRRAAAGEDPWFECGRLDDITTVAYYYLDRPEGNHTLQTGAERGAPANAWPAQDAYKLLGDPET